MKFIVSILFVIVFFNLITFGQDKDSLINLEKKLLAGINPYDEKADPSKDLASILEKIKGTNLRVILQVGGNWCIWCKRLEKMFLDNPDLDSLLKKNFVLLKVNYSKENKNEEFLSKYPKIKGYPHIFVLETDGTLLKSFDTEQLEEDKGYSKKKIIEFLENWKKVED